MLRAYAIPLAVTLASVGGLVVALVFDGVVDLVALCFVVTPLALVARAIVSQRNAS